MKLLKKLYDWVLHWAHTPYGTWALFILAVVESSFFPIPPDVLLIALAISIPAKSFRYAFICSIGSVIGGLFGYLIGYGFMDVVGFRIIEFYNMHNQYESLKISYEKSDVFIVFIAAFTPIPYKLITITAGAFHINILAFAVASIVGRSARFFLVSTLIYYFGPSIRKFIDKYFNLLTIIFTILLVLGFIVIKYVL
jgi:membrane protein YqaA with SNARE-associated domain